MKSTVTGRLPPRFIVQSILGLHRFLIKVANTIVPPQVVLIDHIGGIGNTQLVSAAAQLRVADLLENHGALSSDEIAGQIGTHPEATFRMMRALCTIGIFKLTRTGKFRNNSISKALRETAPGSMKDLAQYFGSRANTYSWSDFLNTIKTGKNAFERVHQMPIWNWFANNPSDSANFTAAMGNLTELDALAVAVSYPFHEIRNLCDLAGGKGTLLAKILNCSPQLRSTLVDTEHVLEEANSYLYKAGVRERVELKAANIFETVLNGFDAFLLKDILHDWDDDRCVQILSNIAKSISTGGRVLVVEVLVEKNSTEKPGPLIDVHMMTVCCEGRQRSKIEFSALFEKCGFKLNRVFKTPYPVSVLEAIKVS